MLKTKWTLLLGCATLLLSAVLLAGTSFAWFTDSITNNGNSIVASENYLTSVGTEEAIKDAVAAGENVSLTANITLNQKLEVTQDLTIIGNGNTISTASGADRVLDVQGNTGAITIRLFNVNLEGPTEGTYTRGISFYNNSNPITLIMDGCTLSANYYALNIASENKNVKLIIRNSKLTGWCAFQTHSPYADVTFENCTLIGTNDKTYNADGWNDFATVVINGYSDGNPDPAGAHDCTLTFKRCEIYASRRKTENKQTLFSVRASNTTLTLEGCSFFINREPITSEQAKESYIEVNDGVENFELSIRD